jgi:dihydrofolate reductase
MPAPEGVIMAASLPAALLAAEARAKADGEDEVMVIGGGEIYAVAMPYADRLYITHVEARPEGDTHFPAIDPAVWKSVSAERLPAGEKDTAATTFVIYERIAAAAAR